MQERHLRPDEIELLLDGEEGFGVAPLRAHVRHCAFCESELDQARELMVALDTLPDFAPSPAFADRVMSQVQVFEPWHAAAMNTAQQFVPASRPARVAAGAGVAVSAGLITAAGTWAVARADIALLMTQIGLENVRTQVSAATSDLVSTVLGQPGLAAMQSSTPEMMALIMGGFVAVTGSGGRASGAGHRLPRALGVGGHGLAGQLRSHRGCRHLRHWAADRADRAHDR